ncbi:phospholipase D [Guyanagaster necrorhizus]|uniref:Phospholipase n=1 Tax=Guyanagaster necrorhizus TaxID=856835 RepID=A0A9P7VMA8_9AGAR|nr:phospholipase D [Guyanagaster necrorhizus MCA 3950]KAG7443153.1 phospholipase D [Guyanagaster necrorhizus MCA 3950]
MRTGPPRSLSYSYSTPNSPATSRNNSKHENGDPKPDSAVEQGDFPFVSPSTDFRDALEFRSASTDKKGKRRESKLLDESWNPLKWFHESPKEEKAGFDFDGVSADGHPREPVTDGEESTKLPPSGLRRISSGPPAPPERKTTGARWGRLRSLIPNVITQVSHSPVTPGPSAVTSNAVNITDELIAGGLSTLMLRLWFERDENDLRRVPVLFHRLRIRVSDSLHPLHSHKSVFRIECEYANGAARWVVYRQLRDFISLHYHYSLSNALQRNVEKIPEFPKTSLPYFKFLQKEGREKGNQVGHADFARLQREALENYLLDLIRAVMFHPAANRLASFLEISALSMYLSPSGGAQYKAGYLRIEAEEGEFGRKGSSWRAKRESRWCAVRESYLVALVEPGELTVWDAFLLDSDFKIERPKRYYRQGLSLLHSDTTHNEDQSHIKAKERKSEASAETEHRSLMGSIKGRFSRALRLNHSTHFHSDHGEEAQDGSSSSSSSVASHAPTPLLDPSTNTNPLSGGVDNQDIVDGEPWKAEKKKKKKIQTDVSKHTFYISNSQMRLRLYARNERQMLQWITAFERVAAASHHTGTNRFNSFAPIRLNVAAQWLVDGRDYFWNLSRAILLARESIYIHDWWLSPELQLRRPNKERYRLDRLLERKAKEGVKICIIVYKEVSSRTTPTDSNYTKQRLASLHPNIMIQRSPSHFQTGTFYWAHHEKLFVIDQAIAFMGGLDACFGRWDTPQHALTDDADDELSQVWTGKDYSNARISDFHTLNKPEEDMHDRTKIPRMPWHDVGMQVVGQPARDLARHFVQRWNYLLRIKNHSRAMPFLLPPPEFRPGELTQMGLTGTCEMQICRSAGPWSLGTASRIEHSIQNAYLKAIQMSEHFVYIENQFFITSTTVNDVRIDNKIGDALVHRIIKADRDGTPWKCCVVIPLLPGFAFPLDHSDGSSIRIILECQNRTISRGSNSIFGRLRKEGIDPDDYITVFSLRNWGKLRDVLTTEQVYIHGKVCIVDDRLAIIGSANINERSQRGDRDSEIAAVIRDTDMIDCTMAGKPFKVGRFAHTLRVRLMREHIGVDVDALYEEDLMASDTVKPEHEQVALNPGSEQRHRRENGAAEPATAGSSSHATTDGVDRGIFDSLNLFSVELNGPSEATIDTTRQVSSETDDDMDTAFPKNTRTGENVPSTTLEEKVVQDHLNGGRPLANGHAQNDKAQDIKRTSHDNSSPNGASHLPSNGNLYGTSVDAYRSPEIDDQFPHVRSGPESGEDEECTVPRARSTLRKNLGSKLGHNNKWTVPTPRPHVDPNGFEDPISDAFWKDVWVACAVHNTEIYRKVFHAVPDDVVTTWKQYKEFVSHHERLNKPVRIILSPGIGRVPSETGDDTVLTSEIPASTEHVTEQSDGHVYLNEEPDLSSSPGVADKEPTRVRSRSTRSTEPFTKAERDEMEKLLGELCGHLVIYPNRFLEGEDVANNFLFNADRLLPLPIYD